MAWKPPEGAILVEDAPTWKPPEGAILVEDAPQDDFAAAWRQEASRVSGPLSDSDRQKLDRLNEQTNVRGQAAQLMQGRADTLSPEDRRKLQGAIDQANVPQTPEWWAQRRYEAAVAEGDPMARMPAIIREPYYAAASASAGLIGAAVRPFSKDAADYIASQREDMGDTRETLRKDDWAPWLSRMYGGAVESLAQATVAAPAGPAGIIGSFALTEGNQALYDAEQAGLKGNERLKYAAVQGAIEGTIAGVFQRFAPGLERLVPQIASGAMKTSGKQFLISTAQELPEELLTELGHAITEAQYGIDPNAMSPEQIGQRMLDTVAQTILTMGIAHGTAKIAQNRQAVEVLEGIRSSESKDIKRKAAEVGITGSRSEVRKQVDSEIDRINSETKQIEQAVQPQEPSDEVRQEVPVEQGAEVPAGEGVQTEGEVQPEVLNREQARLPRQKTIDTDEGEQDFGKDVSGTLGAANVAPITLPRGGAGKSVQHFFQRFFTSRGELPQEVYDAKVRKEGRVAKEMARLRFASTDFRRGITKALGGKELTQADVERINSVLRGEADRSTIPTELHAPLQAMRDHIDSLSRALIAEGVAQGDLIGIIDEHMGVYATRSYRIFDDPKWRDKVPPAIRNRAVAAIREQYPDKSDAEVQGLLESLLFRGAADTPVALLKGSKLGSKDLSTFMKRKEIPEWLRDLWGEYKDAGVNYARSVFKMSHLLANQQFLNSVKESGAGKWLRTAEEGPVVNDYGEVITPIASEGSAVMAPLNGMYTTPEIKRAFERLDSPGALPEWLRVLMAVNSAVKYSKTVGSMMTHIRNLISNTGFAISNNHWRLDKAGQALWGTTTGLFNLPDAKFRAYYERAAELGLVGEDVRAGELKDALRDASEADIDEFLYDAQARQAKKIVRTARSGFRIINSLYHAEDAVWKLYAWENEKARYAAAYPEWSQEQVEQRAAEIVRDTYPTYSKIPEAIKGLRRFPLAGTFVSFPSEVVRTTFHTIQLGLTEMQSPETRSIGAGRLAGTTAAIGALSLLSRGMMALFSIGDDEDDDLRWFVPPWQENSRFIYTAPPENGTYKFVDLGYSDPHAYITDAAIAFMRGDDWQDSLTKALTEFLRPFASEEILAKTLMDVRGNADQSIYNPRDAAGEQARDIITHVWEKSLEPGTIASLRRIRTATEGTDPNLEAKTEVLALTTGQRLQKVDVEHSLGFRVRDFAKALNEIQSIARKTATSRGTVTGEMVSEDRERMEQLRLEEFSQMQRILGAARRLGVPEENIRAMVTGELSDEVAKQVLSGEYVPYKMTTQTVQQMLKANPGEFKERFSAWHGDQLPEATAELRRKRSTWPALRKLSEE